MEVLRADVAIIGGGLGACAAALGAARRLMQASLASGRSGRNVYRRAGRPCGRCGTIVSSRGQGDANRTTYWCPTCQS